MGRYSPSIPLAHGLLSSLHISSYPGKYKSGVLFISLIKRDCFSISVSECNSYNTLAGADRKVTYLGGSILCDNYLSPGWYRLVGAAGTKLSTSPPGTYKCSTHAVSWLNGAHPTVAEGQVTREVCFQWTSGICYGRILIIIIIIIFIEDANFTGGWFTEGSSRIMYII